MTKPRTSPSRELFGLLGSHPDQSRILSDWNRKFENDGIDAFMDRYPTKPAELPERLSEMFHFDRRGYIIGLYLQEAIIPLLDELDPSVRDRVDTVVNRGGVMVGYFCGGDDGERCRLWNCM